MFRVKNLYRRYPKRGERKSQTNYVNTTPTLRRIGHLITLAHKIQKVSQNDTALGQKPNAKIRPAIFQESEIQGEPLGGTGSLAARWSFWGLAASTLMILHALV